MTSFDLISINPEFKRNLWQSFSKERLIAMPIIITALFWISTLHSGLSDIPDHALTIMLLLLVIWGSGLAGDAVFVELRNRTWDAQKMTPLGPWSMAWGKLLGSTIFVWYGAICCLIAILFSMIYQKMMPQNIGFLMGYYLLTGLFAQSFALFTALLFQRISPIFTRARVIYIQIFTIAITGILFYFGKDFFPDILKEHSWFDLNLPVYRFILTTQVFLIGWLIFGIYRLMRTELLMKNYPWDFAAFILFWSLYSMGFFYRKEGDIDPVYYHALYAIVAYFCTIGLTYLAAFFSPKNLVYSRSLIEQLKQHQWRSAATLLPVWTIGSFFAALFLIPVIYFLKHPSFPDNQLDLSIRLIGFCLSLFLFLMRDIGLLYAFNWNLESKPRHLATLVYLIVLYAIVPVLLSLLNFPSYWMPMFAPWTWFFPIGEIDPAHIISILIALLIQIAIVYGILWSRWQAHLKNIR